MSYDEECWRPFDRKGGYLEVRRFPALHGPEPKSRTVDDVHRLRGRKRGSKSLTAAEATTGLAGPRTLSNLNTGASPLFDFPARVTNQLLGLVDH